MKSPGGQSFPSLSGGVAIGMVEGRGFGSSFDKLLDVSNQLLAHSQPASQLPAPFSFPLPRRASTAEDSSLEVTPREDSLVRAWRTVSEIDKLLGSDFIPEEEGLEAELSQPQVTASTQSGMLQELGAELAAAVHASLHFKESLRGSFGTRQSHVMQLSGSSSMSSTMQAELSEGSWHAELEPTMNHMSSHLSYESHSSTSAAMQPPLPAGNQQFVCSALSNQQHAQRAGPGLRLQVGSNLDFGNWTSAGWVCCKDKNGVIIPPGLQQIRVEDIHKIKELGRGCFGTVWLAKWRGVEVAVKELLQAANGADAARQDVFHEAERLAALRHPCIIAFYGICTAPGCYATVVEYLRHGSLRHGLHRLRRQGMVCKHVRALLALQAARGVEYLHSNAVVHFDLKCDNLLCDLRDLSRPVVKVGDLGLSKQKLDSFISGNMRGTLPWMAPELFPAVRDASNVTSRQALSPAAEDKVNEKVDVFSFGVLLWEIWTLGQQPYPNLSLPDIFAGVLTGSLRPDIPSDCDADWASLMSDCWQTAPRLRPSFSEIADRLDAMATAWASSEPSVRTSRP